MHAQGPVLNIAYCIWSLQTYLQGRSVSAFGNMESAMTTILMRKAIAPLLLIMACMISIHNLHWGNESGVHLRSILGPCFLL